MDRLQAEGVGEGRGEDRDVGLERVGQRVDAGVGGQRGRHAERQARLDDRHVGDERVVDERHLASRHGQHRGGRHLRARAGRRRHARPGGPCGRSAGTARRACARRGRAAPARAARARGCSWNRRIALAASMTEPPPTATTRSAAALVEHLHAGADLRPRWARGARSENTCTPAAPRWRRTSSTAPRASVSASVTISTWRGRQPAQALDRAGVEVGVRGNAEPLRRGLAARDGLDVEQVAVVDVVGRRRAAPGPAAEREGRRHARCRRRPARRPRSGALTRMRPVRMASAKRAITVSSCA